MPRRGRDKQMLRLRNASMQPGVYRQELEVPQALSQGAEEIQNINNKLSALPRPDPTATVSRWAGGSIH